MLRYATSELLRAVLRVFAAATLLWVDDATCVCDFVLACVVVLFAFAVFVLALDFVCLDDLVEGVASGCDSVIAVVVDGVLELVSLALVVVSVDPACALWPPMLELDVLGVLLDACVEPPLEEGVVADELVVLLEPLAILSLVDGAG